MWCYGKLPGMTVRKKTYINAQRQFKPQYRVRNWPAYNRSLVNRGAITLLIDKQALSSWRYVGPRQRGRQFLYADAAIDCLLTLRAIFHLTLRATEGFSRSLLQLMDISLPVPDYTTLCRRASSLKVALPNTAAGPLHIVMDSSGLKIYGESEWRAHKHGGSRRRTWRKLHLAVDEKSSEIQATVLSKAGLDDAAVVEALLEQIPAPIVQISADGAYDKRKVYRWCLNKRIAKITIPPRKDACEWQVSSSDCDSAHPPDWPQEMEKALRLLSPVDRRERSVSLQSHLWFKIEFPQSAAADYRSQSEVCSIEPDGSPGDAGKFPGACRVTVFANLGLKWVLPPLRYICATKPSATIQRFRCGWTMKFRRY